MFAALQCFDDCIRQGRDLFPGVQEEGEALLISNDGQRFDGLLRGAPVNQADKGCARFRPAHHAQSAGSCLMDLRPKVVEQFEKQRRAGSRRADATASESADAGVIVPQELQSGLFWQRRTEGAGRSDSNAKGRAGDLCPDDAVNNG